MNRPGLPVSGLSNMLIDRESPGPRVKCFCQYANWLGEVTENPDRFSLVRLESTVAGLIGCASREFANRLKVSSSIPATGRPQRLFRRALVARFSTAPTKPLRHCLRVSN